ncbi:MAG: putative lipid II flippase FtsW [Thermodesulfobacteriota bacterium]|nr:putative lipid II flippase FtsW [Thermodesulfobacteriota bacterium]
MVKKKTGIDNTLLICGLLLVSTGIVMVYSSSAIVAQEKFQNEYYFLKKQILFALVGILMMVIVSKVDHRVYKKIPYLFLGMSFVSLIAVLLPGIGITAGGSTRWLSLGMISIQPSEFAKLALIIYLAYSLAKKDQTIKKFSVGVLPHLIISGIMLALIIIEPDMGTAMCIGAVVCILLFVAGVRIGHLFLIFLFTIPLVYFLIFNTPYRRQRIFAFLNPWEYANDSGFQVIQSLYAFGSGGIFGRGLGDGKQKLFYLPETHTDFIFSVIGEELGLLGVIVILVIFAFLIYRGIMISVRTPDLFSMYLALGITSLIGLQAIIHMGVTLGLLPTKGIPLPLVSYGGSSLLTSLVALGILMNISSFARKG